MKNLLFAIGVISLLASCRTIRIGSKSVVYKINKDNQLQAYHVDKKYEEDLTPNADNIIVLDNSDPTVFTNSGASVKITPSSSWGPEVLDNYFYGDVSSIVKAAKAKAQKDNTPFPAFDEQDNLNYYKGYAVLQALTVPFKLRSKLSGTQYPNNVVYSNVETGFTANLSFGYKFSWNRFLPSKDKVLGLNTYSISFTPGVFAGLSTVALTNSNTIGLPASYGTAFSRSALTKSFGVFTLVGISRFGFGYAGGFDYADGPGGGNWIYKGRWWNGVALSIDLVNF